MNTPYRVALSETATSTLKSLTQKTGLSANILARFAMLISFEMPDQVVPDMGKTNLVINRTTLFGDLEAFLMAAYALSGGKKADSFIAKDLAAHIARGSAFLNLRTQTFSDFLGAICDHAGLKIESPQAKL